LNHTNLLLDTHTQHRFGYTHDYLENLIKTVLAPLGFTTVVEKNISPRLDAGDAVPGFLYVLHKT
jgi:predicted TPR repeat methyltransferase